MTPQEALAQALTEAAVRDNVGITDEAAAILDALPVGWALLNAEGAILLTKATLAKERERLRKAVEAITPSCHSHSGLNCEKDEFGWCHLIDRADVLALLASPEKS